MESNMLSQEEIDALLDVSTEQTSTPEAAAPNFSDLEKDTLGEIGNISMGTAATTMSLLLNRRVQITIPRVSITTPREISEASPLPFIVVEVSYTEGLRGRNLLMMRTNDGAVIADLMMGRDGIDPQEEIDEFVLSALGEAMNQMMGSAATSLSSMFNKTISISPPTARIIDLGSEPLDSQLMSDECLAKIAFRMTVEDLIDSEIMLLLQINFAREMIGLLMPEEHVVSTAALPAAPPPAPPAPAREAAAVATLETAVSSGRNKTVSSEDSGSQTLARKPIAQPVTAQAVEFQPLPQTTPPPGGTGNLQLLLDVPLQLTVELGRTEKSVKEILGLVPGSIFELDRVAGEPVDIYVNGKLIAKGEVVVIDENFGVRITDIVSIIDRVSNLQ